MSFRSGQEKFPVPQLVGRLGDGSKTPSIEHRTRDGDAFSDLGASVASDANAQAAPKNSEALHQAPQRGGANKKMVCRKP